MITKIIYNPENKEAEVFRRHEKQKNSGSRSSLNFKIPLTLIVFLLLMTSSFIICPGIFETEAEAFSIGLRGEGFYTTFADTGILQNEEIQLEPEDVFDDTLSFDITSAPGFALGAVLEPRAGTRFILDAGLLSTSDSDSTTGEGGTEARVDAIMLLPSLQLSGEINIAEFAEMYDIPSIIFYGGAGYYHSLGEITFENVIGESDRDLTGGGIGFRAGSRLAFELSESLEIKGTLGYRRLEIKFDRHTDLSGPEIGAGITFTF